MLNTYDYNKSKMLKLVSRDLLLNIMYKGLGNDDSVLQVIFNSEVLGDSQMERIYNEL